MAASCESSFAAAGHSGISWLRKGSPVHGKGVGGRGANHDDAISPAGAARPTAKLLGPPFYIGLRDLSLRAIDTRDRQLAGNRSGAFGQDMIRFMYRPLISAGRMQVPRTDVTWRSGAPPTGIGPQPELLCRESYRLL